jgi:phage tail sheath protein FI
MAIQISPGVAVSETDLTTVVPSVLTTTGAFAGAFKWGPANKRIQITSENQLVQRFYKPDSNTYTSFFTAASFLAYGNNLQLVRTLGTNHKNASSNTSASIVVSNEDQFEYTYLNNLTNANVAGPFIARYVGALGNSISVSVMDGGANTTQFNKWSVNGVNISSYFPTVPGTSVQATSSGSSNDEIHIIVVDTGGQISGTVNTVLEVFPYLSKGSDAKDSLGNSNYYKNYIFRNSKYIYAIDPVQYSSTSSTWGLPLAGTNYATISAPSTNNSVSVTLVNGVDDTPTDSATTSAFSLFANKDEVDVSLVFTGDASVTVQQSIIENIVTTAGSVTGRSGDAIAFISPPSTSVVNQSGNEYSNIQTWATQLARSSSYVVADSGWKYMFDKYNNVYRWVPLNGDIAGLCVYTDSVTAPWYSPAGYNRGNIKNVVKLAWNPTKPQRDTLYALGVNPVGTFPGQGTVLFGDKTLQSKPSAFDRINVRRLFIVLEKAISQASKFSLFEFNDVNTQNQFVSLITPFLTDIKARRGIYDFKVVCDSTNNTPQVIDSNQFVGDIYIKPARSINYIQLNFVAVRTGVDFTTVVNAA